MVNGFMQIAPPCDWDGAMPVSTGLLIFDKTGALLGGGVVQPVPNGDDNKSEPKLVIGNRWLMSLAGYDWAPKLSEGETEMNVCLVDQACVTMMQTTMMQLGQAWIENEATWAGRMEGAMTVMHSMGIEINQEARPKPNGKDTTHGSEKGNTGKHDGFVDTSSS